MKLVAKHAGETIPVEVERHGSGYSVMIADRVSIVDFVNAGPYVYSLRLDDGTQLSLTHHREGNVHEIAFLASEVVVEILDPLSLRRKSSEDAGAAGGVLEALMPGRIVRVLVAPGDAVSKGAGLVILEAMKMENEIQAPVDGIIEKLFVSVGDTVERGAPLVQIG